MSDPFDDFPDDFPDGFPSHKGSKSEAAPAPVEVPPIEIPIDALSTEALDGIIESFILREGTDYGAVEVSHDAKIKQVHKQIDSGDVCIVFDPGSESVTLMSKREFNRLQASSASVGQPKG